MLNCSCCRPDTSGLPHLRLIVWRRGEGMILSVLHFLSADGGPGLTRRSSNESQGLPSSEHASVKSQVDAF